MIIGMNRYGGNYGIWKFVERNIEAARGNYWFQVGGGARRGIAVGRGGKPYVVNSNGQSYWPNRPCRRGVRKVWYYTSKMTLSWIDAFKWCHRNGFHLAPIYTEKENFVLAADPDVSVQDSVWIGGRRYGTHWRWASNFAYKGIMQSHMSFRNWASGRPFVGKGNCAALTRSGHWTNAHCNREKAFICRSFNAITGYNAWIESPNMCRSTHPIRFLERKGRAISIAENANGVRFIVGKNGQVYRYSVRNHFGVDVDHWTRIGSNVKARHVAVGRNGNPWIVAKNGGIWRFYGLGWVKINGKAYDIAIGGLKKQAVYVISTKNTIWKKVRKGWKRIRGPKARRIAVDLAGQPVVVTTRGDIARRTVFNKRAGTYTW